ncbi:isoprenylcysteine carboxyl methyltransferase family protein [Bacillus marinisedimentorum]|uniref:isoprenylcysteine carboxyl methyltransferase family protein n=1 Tax=Bacillus marinisedimentorum TaxID=1821260 RepID=UPI0007DECA76|nr:isoprenylcysteine carboxylmethyltransferase family protein [Bacillus marinisedimentorum]
MIARRNEAWMKSKGAREHGRQHYKYIVLVHVLFFFMFFVEGGLIQRSISDLWPLWLALFVFAQAMRVWALFSLGKFWNTKIIVLPGADVVAKGPYKYIRHPNYVVVALEFLSAPLLFDAYLTAALFTLLNIIVLSIRIPAEEKALREATDYSNIFEGKSRFTP